MNNTLKYIWILLAIMLAGLTGFAQETNVLVLTPIEPHSIFPVGKDAIWLALIPPITFFISWVIGKIPPIPNQLIPWLTPVFGIMIGSGLDWANKANFAWWHSAGAGAIAVFLYEAIKNLGKKGGAIDKALTPNPPPK